MTDLEIIEKTLGVFRQVFSNPILIIAHETTSADIDDWDSLNHMKLIVALENEFKIRFRAQEIVNLENVGEMYELIRNKIAK